MCSCLKNNLKLFLKKQLTNNFSYGNILVDKKKQNKKGVKDYEKDLKEVYKVEECTCRNEACIAITQRTIYRGYLLKRGVEVQTTAECSINGTGEIEWIYY